MFCSFLSRPRLPAPGPCFARVSPARGRMVAPARFAHLIAPARARQMQDIALPPVSMGVFRAGTKRGGDPAPWMPAPSSAFILSRISRSQVLMGKIPGRYDRRSRAPQLSSRPPICRPGLDPGPRNASATSAGTAPVWTPDLRSAPSGVTGGGLRPRPPLVIPAPEPGSSNAGDAREDPACLGPHFREGDRERCERGLTVAYMQQRRKNDIIEAFDGLHARGGRLGCPRRPIPGGKKTGVGNEKLVSGQMSHKVQYEQFMIV